MFGKPLLGRSAHFYHVILWWNNFRTVSGRAFSPSQNGLGRQIGDFGIFAAPPCLTSRRDSHPEYRPRATTVTTTPNQTTCSAIGRLRKKDRTPSLRASKQAITPALRAKRSYRVKTHDLADLVYEQNGLLYNVRTCLHVFSLWAICSMFFFVLYGFSICRFLFLLFAFKTICLPPTHCGCYLGKAYFDSLSFSLLWTCQSSHSASLI